VLIVEDDSAIRSVLCRALAECDYAVCSAGTGMGGVQLAVGSGSPDIVLLDLGLPDIDGVDALRPRCCCGSALGWTRRWWRWVPPWCW
jgi:DNA-binding response OmpR family regulator